ncbi:polymeric immunoglobulin receptor isoform X2 [Athene cunicularia]|uniref:polymeric immunoglobulin receptor isoform X2 n=1 Tax=Athene cunicularia TaxID=194338 RepID=UPI000EF741A5|nr:polymeric immunoglobulin receptor isoform X2 [Athene cunicularia]
MTLLAFVFLLAFLPAEAAISRHPPKSSISSPVFGPRQVYGLLNGSVTVKCFYPPTSVNRHDRKYWCRESAMGCMTIVSTSGYTAPGYKGRVSITDYPQAENFQINISELTMADAGTYQCGVGVNSKGLCHKVSLDVSKGPHVPEGAELFYVKLHSTLTMSCSFGPDYASVRKFLCKMEKDGCRNVIDSYGNIATDYTGRVLMSSEGTPGSFSVVITQMGWKDSGLYLCGVGFYGEDGETKELDVHVYEESKVPQAKPIITGVKGTSATFECRYNPLQRSSGRYWCKWRQNGCSRIIDTSGYVSYAYEGRVAIFDSPENTTMTIILNQLSDKDNGYYWCMTDEQKEQQSSTELKIIDGQPGLTGKKEVEAQAGSRVDLACYYPCKYYSYQKYWCKWNNTGCSVLPASDQRQPGPGVTCDRDNKTVILSFDPVEKTNEGWYWCGVKRNGVYGETMAVHLSVTGGSQANHGLKILDVEPPSHAEEPPSRAEEPPSHAEEPPSHAKEPPSHAGGGFIAQGRAFSDAGVGSAAASGSSDQSRGSSTLTLALSLTGAALLVLVTAFAVYKYRQLTRSDVVSIGSYRTNISMSDFESVKGYSASNNACVKESQETEIGGEEFTTATTATQESAAETKKAKRSSKEDADLAYSTFLLTSSSIAQAGTEGVSAAPDASSPSWGGQI